MSWDIVLFSSSETIKSVADLNDEELVPIDFDEVLLNYFQNNNIEDNAVTVTAKDFSFVFYLDNEQVSNKIIHLYGEQALKEIIELSKAQKWQIYDTGLGGMINLELPSKNGWSKFNDYLRHVIKKTSS